MTEQDLINDFNNLTQMAYGLYDILSVVADTTPKYFELRKIETQTENNIRKFIKKHFHKKNIGENLKIHILKYLTDIGGDFNGNDTLGRRNLNYCSNPTKHTEEKYDCCYAVYLKELKQIEERAEKRKIQEKQEKELQEEVELLRTQRRARYTDKKEFEICYNMGHKNKCRNCLKGALIIGRPQRREEWNEVENLVYPYEEWCAECCGGEDKMGNAFDNKSGATDYKTGELIIERKCKCGCWNNEEDDEQEEQVVFKGRAFE